MFLLLGLSPLEACMHYGLEFSTTLNVENTKILQSDICLNFKKYNASDFTQQQTACKEHSNKRSNKVILWLDRH